MLAFRRSGKGQRASAERNGFKTSQEKRPRVASGRQRGLQHRVGFSGSRRGVPGNSRSNRYQPGRSRRTSPSGTAQYAETLPLRDHEAVLSFDDGPSPVTTNKVLDALAAECVKANFFIVGEHAKERPDLVRRAYRDGHAIGTHSQTHADLARLSFANGAGEINDGIRSVQAALGPNKTVAPFFGAPYLQMTSELERFLIKRALMLWSSDIDPEDWRPQSSENVVEYVLSSLETKRLGIILLHDVQPHTAAAIPTLLRTLKTRGYSIVQMVATDTEANPAAEATAANRPGNPGNHNPHCRLWI
jgi:peptidoglycan/xylan/chitin deacetylase (PgdA/CDA1 family)